MKDSKEKAERIHNLRDMIDHMSEENEEPVVENKSDIEEDIEEDEELINFLNEDDEDFEIDDEYIYRPGKEDDINASNLEEEAEIDENFIIEADINEELDEKSQIVNHPSGFDDDISENFDNIVNIKIGEKPILAIISSILGIIFIVASIFVFNSGTERIIDNVVSGENNFLVVILLIIGILLLIYGIFKLFNIKSPFDSMMESMNEAEKENLNKKEDEPEEPTIPKSNIPLDKDSYKIGEFKMNELKNNLKNSFSKTVNKSDEDEENVEEEINVEDLPPAREKSADNKGLIKEEIEEKDYEQAQLDGESIDDIFANAEDLNKKDD
ncbi:MAG: topoisomerase IV [Methanobrevibacter sp.]|uniref:topoisomerase IV n=1 Tax=Methanobrevibacter sp. TaxID=66852 RepID=UPI001B15AAC3|nr:topoisomerase IV [Methanobrevibacter sp.]MBO5151398.1 topoisomerase IV [Methanobrevibacter sp.]